MPEPQVAVVGAGPAGVAAAVALKDRRLRPLLIDQADEVAPVWRARYDRLRLNTCRPLSHLPGRRFAKGTPMFPSRDQLVEHLDQHAREDGIDLQLGTHVDRIERSNGGWALHTSAGEVRVPQVVVATGYESEPVVPDWPGRDLFEGELTHSDPGTQSHSRTGVVLVVGPGCSGMEIAHDLAEGGAHARCGSPRERRPTWGGGGGGGNKKRGGGGGEKKRGGGKKKKGILIPERGGHVPASPHGQAPQSSIARSSSPSRRDTWRSCPSVESLDRTGVQLAGGPPRRTRGGDLRDRVQAELEALVGISGVLDESGMPRALDQRSQRGGSFVGHVPRPGALGYMGKEAARAARAIARELG